MSTVLLVHLKKNECPPSIFQCILKLSCKAMRLSIDRKEIKAQDFNPVCTEKKHAHIIMIGVHRNKMKVP